ncbi:MAG: IPT/TIG domain-containing protein, partial [Candidatus Nomurabacteria bacterium]|nr:IPT/TIG domain-containing protein [Candidatus Nomurabacteria bacterium]
MLCLLIVLIYPVIAYISGQISRSVNALTTQDFSYTSAAQTFTAPQTGIYQLEVWGASGDDAAFGNSGGTGGYSVGTVSLNGGDVLYVYTGGLPDSDMGGFNGGGDGDGRGGGGGGTDIRIGTDSYYARAIVAGGGSASGDCGGGETDCDGSTSQIYGSEFGFSGSYQGDRGWYGGGGGWYGGANNGVGNLGGSGWVYTASAYAYWAANSSEGQSGQWLLSPSYYLTNAQTIAGDTAFPAPGGGNETGHAGNGHARITQLTAGSSGSSSPTITSITPNSGPVAGGQVVTIAGTNLQRLTMPAWRSVGVAGGRHHCAIAADNYIYCWGYNGDGVLGNGTNTSSSIPVRVSQGAMPNQNGAKAIGDGVYSNCAIASDNWVYCWGANGNGALGNGPATAASNTPVKVSQGAIPANATIKKLAIGQDGGCVIASDDWAYCWGRNADGQVGNPSASSPQRTPIALNHDNIPSGAKIVDLSMGFGYGCAIIDTGAAYCWGNNGYGALGDGTSTARNKPVAVSMPSGVTFSQITAGGVTGSGSSVTCATATNGDAYCWGYGSWRQVGNGTTTATNNTPKLVSQGARPSGVGFRSVTTGSYNASYTVVCGLGTDNKVYCWGTGDTGELGNGTANGTSNVPAAAVSMPSGVTVLQLATGSDHSCAIGSDYNMYCWGYGDAGRLGNNATSNQSTPVKVSKATVMDTYAPYSVTIGGVPCTIANPATDITTTSVICTTSAHAAGVVDVVASNGATTAILQNGYTYVPPISITSITPNYGLETGGTNVTITGTGFDIQNRTVVQVAAGRSHVIALTSDGKLYTWGSNNFGQLGDGTMIDSFSPIEVNTAALAGKTIVDIAAGLAGSFAVTSDGSVFAWGSNCYGELGLGTLARFLRPTLVQGDLAGKNIIQVSTGEITTMAIDSNGAMYAWGDNTYGQFGNGSTAASNIPILISPVGDIAGKTIKYIGTNSDVNGYGPSSPTIGSTCAIASDDKVYCWGDGTGGQLGNGSTSSSLVPVAVSTASTPAMASVSKLAKGSGAACAIASDSKLYCWGSAQYGSLGNGSTMSSVPVAVSQGDMPSTAGIVDVSVNGGGSGAVSRSSVCAIASDHKAYCWGNGGAGQLGNGTTSDRSTPTAVSTSGALSGKSLQSIVMFGNQASSAGGAVTIDQQGAVYVWGSNNLSLGDGTSGNSLTPVATTATLINGPAAFTVTLDMAGTPAPCANVVIVSSTTITCTTSAHVPGLVSVTVNNGTNSVTLPATYKNPSGDLNDPTNVQSG